MEMVRLGAGCLWVYNYKHGESHTWAALCDVREPSEQISSTRNQNRPPTNEKRIWSQCHYRDIGTVRKKWPLEPSLSLHRESTVTNRLTSVPDRQHSRVMIHVPTDPCKHYFPRK